MRISVKWLRELCAVAEGDDEIARRLTMAGLEVEGRETRAIGPGVVAARIVQSARIEGSEHLSLCQVDDGAGTHQVVCGAQNYAAGDVVPMARVGARLPGGLEIRRAKLRGVDSEGMLCSERELGLSDDHAGLMLLPRETRIGMPLDELLGLPDTVFEVNVTPNRPDALSHLGIARELSALTGVPVRMPFVEPAGRGADLPARVDLEDPQRCPRYVARIIEGVRVGPSPLRVQERLRACGVRPISNVVDASNLALLELGHPLHAFDLDQLAGRRIVVRRAREGEKMTTLDGKERSLSSDDLVIADADKPVALAGVMGGATSEVSDSTTRILLESAMFEPAGIRRTARRHALHTEASHRFERGMDERTADLAANRCAELIVQLAGGRVLPGALDAYPSPLPAVHLRVRPERVSAVLGVSVPEPEVDRWLQAMQLAREGEQWRVPSWRRDLTREIDLIEEIARLRGYDTIPIEIHKAGVGETAAIVPERRAEAAARASLAASGFDEAVNYSFGPEKDMPKPALRVANPLTPDQSAMRTVMLDGLLRNLAYNFARGAHELRLYELGRVYLPNVDPRHPSGELAWPAHEPRRLGLVMSGARRKGVWEPARKLDYFDLKGAVEELLAALRVPEAAFRLEEHRPLHPVNSTLLFLGGAYAGLLGQLHPRSARYFELPEDTFVAELEWEVLAAHAVAVPQAHGVPRFPALARDMAFVVDRSVPAAQMIEEIRATDAAGLLEQVELFDDYDQEPYRSAGKRSLAFRMSLRAPDRTLTDAEADALCAAIKGRLKSRLAAELRA